METIWIEMKMEVLGMDENYRKYRTGQGVPLTGEYICQSGKKAKLNKDDDFPACPVSDEETTWTHEDQ